MPDTVLALGEAGAGETTGSLPTRDTKWVLQRRREQGVDRVGLRASWKRW